MSKHRPCSDCSFKSSLIRICTVCLDLSVPVFRNFTVALIVSTEGMKCNILIMFNDFVISRELLISVNRFIVAHNIEKTSTGLKEMYWYNKNLSLVFEFKR